MLYFLSSRLSTETELALFGVAVDPGGVASWAFFVALAAAGAFAVKRSFPPAAAAWNDAIAAARARPGA